MVTDGSSESFQTDKLPTLHQNNRAVILFNVMRDWRLLLPTEPWFAQHGLLEAHVAERVIFPRKRNVVCADND